MAKSNTYCVNKVSLEPNHGHLFVCTSCYIFATIAMTKTSLAAKPKIFRGFGFRSLL